MKQYAKIIWALWIILALVGGYGLIERLVTGHRLATYSSYVPWGMWVAAYIFFVGLSSGSFLLASLYYVFKITRLERIARLSLFTAGVTIIMALVTVGLDLGRMEKAVSIFYRPHVSSMITWEVWLYTAYLILVFMALKYAVRKELKKLAPQVTKDDEQKLKRLMAYGIALVIAFTGAGGALFGTISARAAWHTSLYPVLFIVGALLSGVALMTFMAWAFCSNHDESWHELLQFLGKLVLGLTVTELILEWAEFSIPLWYGIGPEAELIKDVLFGPFWYVFWLVRILLGAVLPLYLLMRKKDAKSIGIASFLVAVTYFAVRLNLVIPAQVTPELRGLEHAYMDPIGNHLSFHYLPSFFEWQVLMGVVALGVALFYVGQRYLPVMKTLNNREVSR
jgi:molybdopterin-containing oxidoreductase family membrane subunit